MFLIEIYPRIQFSVNFNLTSLYPTYNVSNYLVNFLCRKTCKILFLLERTLHEGEDWCTRQDRPLSLYRVQSRLILHSYQARLAGTNRYCTG